MLKTWYFPIQHFGRQSISPPPPPQINVSNYALNHFLVWFCAKESLRSAKNVVFSLFCILVGRPMGGAIAPPAPPPSYATDLGCDFLQQDPALNEKTKTISLWKPLWATCVLKTTLQKIVWPWLRNIRAAHQGVEPTLNPNRKPEWTVSFWWTWTEPEPTKFYFSEPEPNLNPQNRAQVNPNRTWTPNKVRIYFSISECRWRWYTQNKRSGDHQQDQQFLLFFSGRNE